MFSGVKPISSVTSSAICCIASSRFQFSSPSRASNPIVRLMSCGQMASTMLSVPPYRQTVEVKMTSTIVQKMQMVAMPAPLRFMRYAMADTLMKWRV